MCLATAALTTASMRRSNRPGSPLGSNTLFTDSVSTGGLVGAAVGGYAGSKIGKGSGNLAATAGGAVAGYIVGQEIERELTRSDP